MTYRNRAVCVQQKHCHRLAHNVGAAYYHAAFTRNFYVLVFKHFHYARGRAGYKIIFAYHYAPYAVGIECVNVLFGCYAVDYQLFIKVGRQRQLAEYAVNAFLIIKRIYKL